MYDSGVRAVSCVYECIVSMGNVSMCGNVYDAMYECMYVVASSYMDDVYGQHVYDIVWLHEFKCTYAICVLIISEYVCDVCMHTHICYMLLMVFLCT